MMRLSEEVSMTKKDKTPTEIDDEELDAATGGLLSGCTERSRTRHRRSRPRHRIPEA